MKFSKKPSRSENLKKADARARKQNPFDAKSKLLQAVYNNRGASNNMRGRLASSTILRTSKLKDRRIGESDLSLSHEQKISKRFELERLKKYRKTSEALASIPSGGVDFPMSGKRKIEYEDDESDDELSRSGQLSASFVSKAHFGGFEDDSEDDCGDPNLVPLGGQTTASKSRKEIMAEIIKNSKLAKHQRQAQKESLLDLTDKLDESWKSLIKGDAVHSLTTAPKSQHRPAKSGPDSYDVLLRQLQFDGKSGSSSVKVQPNNSVAVSDTANDSFQVQPSVDYSAIESFLVSHLASPGNLKTAEEKLKPLLSECFKVHDKKRIRKLCLALFRFADCLCCHQLSEPRADATLNLVQQALCKLQSQAPNVITNAVLKIIDRYRLRFKSASPKAPEEMLSYFAVLRLSIAMYSSAGLSSPVLSCTFFFGNELLAYVNGTLRNEKQLIFGLLLSVILLDCVRDTKHYLPDIMRFLLHTVSMASSGSELCTLVVSTPLRSQKLLFLHDEENLSGHDDVKPLSISAMLSQTEAGNCGEFKASALKLVLALLSALVELWNDVASFQELFSPVHNALLIWPVDRYPKQLRDSVAQLTDLLNAKLGSNIRPALRFEVGRVTKEAEFRFLEPSFESSSSSRKNAKKNNREKVLRRQFKTELRKTRKELRCVRQLISREELAEHRRLDLSRKRKTKELMSSLLTV